MRRDGERDGKGVVIVQGFLCWWKKNKSRDLESGSNSITNCVPTEQLIKLLAYCDSVVISISCQSLPLPQDAIGDMSASIADNFLLESYFEPLLRMTNTYPYA